MDILDPKNMVFHPNSAFSDELWPKINMTEKLHVFFSQGRFDIHHSGLQWHCCAFKWPISWKLTEFWKIRVENPTSKVRLFGPKYYFTDHCAIRHAIHWISSKFSKRAYQPGIISHSGRVVTRHPTAARTYISMRPGGIRKVINFSI